MLMVSFFGIAFVTIILRLKKHQETGITLFLIIFYIACLVVNYYGDTKHFDYPNDAFYFAYTVAIVEAAMTNRMPKFSYRIIFAISLLVIRQAIITPNDKSTIPMHILCQFFSIYLDFDREKKDKNLFGSYFYSRDQLSKFKDLVVNNIPDSIVIMTKDLNQCLFANNSFNILNEGTYVSSIRSCLEKFRIQEIPSDFSLSTTERVANHNGRTQPQQQTLLNFLENYTISNISEGLCNVVVYEKEDQYEMTESSVDPTISKSKGLIFEVKVMTLVWDEKPAIGVILHDITQQNTILRLKIAANIQKDRLLATVSHELRTPLNSMLGMIQVVLQRIKDADLVQYLNICNSSGHLLLGLVNSILDMNLIRANKLKLNTEKIDLRETLEDIMKLFEFQCAQKSIFLKLKISPIVPKTVVTDKNRLSQIFINLIGNALKFTEKGGITISIRKSLDVRDYIEMSVEDTGLGIKEEDKEKLFKMFGKLEDERGGGTIVNKQGVGLGLTISNNLAKLLCDHKEIGGIRVESEYKKGSKFMFMIRNKKRDSLMSQGQEVKCVSSNFSSQILDEGEGVQDKIMESYTCKSPLLVKPLFQVKELVSPLLKKEGSLLSRESQSSVLIIDDNPLNITVAEFFVKRLGCQTKSALYGKVGIDIVLKNDYVLEPIKLILMDLQMPIMDGYETTKVLKNLMAQGKVPEIPIIALTANDTESDKKACIEAGMSGHLCKPLKEVELKRLLNEYN